LGENFTGYYYAPADKGHPSYKYYWADYLKFSDPGWVADDAWFSAKAIKKISGNNLIEERSICIKIADSAGHVIEKAKNVKIHDYYETAETGLGTGDKKSDKEILARLIFTPNFPSANISVTTNNSWEFGGKVEGEGNYGLIKVKVGFEAKHSFGKGQTKTMNIVGKPGDVVLAICYPSYSFKEGTWKRWGVGLEDEGRWRNEYGETMTFTTVEESK